MGNPPLFTSTKQKLVGKFTQDNGIPPPSLEKFQIFSLFIKGYNPLGFGEPVRIGQSLGRRRWERGRSARAEGPCSEKTDIGYFILKGGVKRAKKQLTAQASSGALCGGGHIECTGNEKIRFIF